MLNRTHVIGTLAVLLVASIGAGAYYLGVDNGTREAAIAVAPTPAPSNELNAELDRIQVAEKIEDPYERCMAYPNPAEFNWSPSVIEVMCKRLSRRMLGWKEIEDALANKHPELLAQAFDGYLARNEAGEHGFLTWSFWWMFQSSSKWADDITDKWVQADPKSAYALVARGLHYTESAYAARGDDFASKTPAENFVRTHEFVRKARADLQQSLERNPRLIAA